MSDEIEHPNNLNATQFGPPTGEPQRQPLGPPGRGRWKRTEQGAWQRSSSGRTMSKPTAGPNGTFYEDAPSWANDR